MVPMTRTISASIVMALGAGLLWGGLALGSAAPASAKERCVFLADQPGGKLLINACNGCRVVTVERRRPSHPAPTYRTYTLPANSKSPLTTRGRDRTRVTREERCESPAQEAQTEAQRLGQCILLSQTRKGEPALLNQCDPCRSAVVELIGADGLRTRKLFNVLGNTFETFDADGAQQARVIGERDCRK